MIRFLIDATTFALKKVSERRRVDRRFNIALAYNKEHTYSSTGKWMCPTCNKVHGRSDWSVFSGLQFPPCCGFEEGHRLHSFHATGQKS